MNKRIIELPQADGKKLHFEHDVDISGYLIAEDTNRLIAYSSDAKQVYIWDKTTAQLLTQHNLEDSFQVSKDGQWLITREMIDYGNGQEEFLYIYYIGQEGKISQPMQFTMIQSWICYGIDVWFDAAGTLWTDGEYNDEASKPGKYIYDCKQYALSHDGEGNVQLTLLQVFPSPEEVLEPEDNGLLVEHAH